MWRGYARDGPPSGKLRDVVCFLVLPNHFHTGAALIGEQFGYLRRSSSAKEARSLACLRKSRT